MTEFHLELWISPEEQVVSFNEVDGWMHCQYQSQDEMLQQLDQLVANQFRFQ